MLASDFALPKPGSSLSSRSPRRIAVLGGGIAGLAAAYTLARGREGGADIEEFLIEASPRLGGVIRTEHVDGFVIEGGPDSFLTEKPEAAALCRELGLGDSLLGSNDRARRTYILHRRRLVPLPEGLQLFIPNRFWPILTTPLLSPRSKLCVLSEWLRGRKSQGSDESVADFVRRHFGSEMVENIADPLLAGIFGGDSNSLSVRAVLPRFWLMEQKYGSLARAALKARREANKTGRPLIQTEGDSPQPPRPLFTTLKGGLERMAEELGKRLSPRVCLGQRVVYLNATDSGARRYRIGCEGDITHEADAVILALPAYECGRLVWNFDPAVGDLLKSISYASALAVALAYDDGVDGRIPPGFGFLVPQKEKCRLLACTFVHNKFSQRVPAGKALLRCFLGGTRDPDVMTLDDSEIVWMVRRELRGILDISQEPLLYRIYRWPGSMPQYAVGHQELIASMQAQLANHPGLFLAGNAYSGIGISDSIRTGKAAANAALERCRSH